MTEKFNKMFKALHSETLPVVNKGRGKKGAGGLACSVAETHILVVMWQIMSGAAANFGKRFLCRSQNGKA